MIYLLLPLLILSETLMAKGSDEGAAAAEAMISCRQSALFSTSNSADFEKSNSQVQVVPSPGEDGSVIIQLKDGQIFKAAFPCSKEEGKNVCTKSTVGIVSLPAPENKFLNLALSPYPWKTGQWEKVRVVNIAEKNNMKKWLDSKASEEELLSVKNNIENELNYLKKVYHSTTPESFKKLSKKSKQRVQWIKDNLCTLPAASVNELTSPDESKSEMKVLLGFNCVKLMNRGADDQVTDLDVQHAANVLSARTLLGQIESHGLKSPVGEKEFNPLMYSLGTRFALGQQGANQEEFLKNRDAYSTNVKATQATSTEAEEYLKAQLLASAAGVRRSEEMGFASAVDPSGTKRTRLMLEMIYRRKRFLTEDKGVAENVASKQIENELKACQNPSIFPKEENYTKHYSSLNFNVHKKEVDTLVQDLLKLVQNGHTSGSWKVQKATDGH